MSLFRKKPKEEVKEEPRDDYIELGTTSILSDGYMVTTTNNVYNVTLEEMVARLGKITCDNEKRNAFIVQSFMTLKEHDELVEKHSKHIDNLG